MSTRDHEEEGDSGSDSGSDSDDLFALQSSSFGKNSVKRGGLVAPVLKVSEIFEKELSKQEEQTLDLKREAREEKKKQQMKKALSKRLELTKACAESCKELVPCPIGR